MYQNFLISNYLNFYEKLFKKEKEDMLYIKESRNMEKERKKERMRGI